MDWISGVASGVGSLLSAGIGAITNKKSQKRAYEYNSLLQQQSADLQNQNWFAQYERQLEDQLKWREDERYYNSPAAQLQRMRDAGINPVFGSSGLQPVADNSSPNSFGAAASVGTPSVGNYQTQFGNFLNEGLQAALALRGMRVQEKKVGIEENMSVSDIEKNNAEILNILSEKDLNEKRLDEISQKILESKASVDHLAVLAQKVLSDSAVNWVNAQTQIMATQFQHEYWEGQNQIGYIEANASTSQAMTRKAELNEMIRWHDEQRRQFDVGLRQKIREFDHLVEKDGAEAVLKIIKESSWSAPLGLGRNMYTNRKDLQDRMAAVASVAKYISGFDLNALPASGKSKSDAYDSYLKVLNSAAQWFGQIGSGPLVYDVGDVPNHK